MDDANNDRLEPGVVIAYERNTHTISKMLLPVEVITIPLELGKGRGRPLHDLPMRRRNLVFCDL